MKYIYVLSFLFFSSCSLFGQSDFSQDNATHILKVLSVEIGPRPMGSPAEHRALEFAVNKFKEYGCDTAYIMPMNHSSQANTTSGIAIGIMRGSTKRIICIGGHMDSAGPEVPGTDDDGSGSATVIELCRTFANRRMHSTLMFCCFGGEEAGLEGSRYFVGHFEDLDSIDLMLQIDMANGVGPIELDPEAHEVIAPRWLVRAAIEEFYNLGYRGLEYPTHFFSLNYAFSEGSGSDHESFLKAGIPAIDFTTDVSKPIHTPRDNWENFDPRGLKRSGDVVQRLVERFDGGVPDRKTDQYWLYLIDKTPIFLPIWVLWIFLAGSILVALFAFVNVRRRREPPGRPDRIRWSGIKMFVFTVIVISFAWFSSDIVGFIRGYRHPAFNDFTLYLLYAFFFLLLGIWLLEQLARKFPLTRCPYVFFKRSAIILVTLSIVFGLGSIKLSVYPVLTLLLFSIAILGRNSSVKIVCALLAPLPLARFVFNEWFSLFAHSFASIPEQRFLVAAGINGGAILVFTIFLFPVMLALAAIDRDTAALHNVRAALSSKTTLAIFLLGCVIMTIILIQRPVYDNLWYRKVHVNESFNLSEHTKEITLKSPEYLSGIRIHRANSDTVIEDRTATARFDQYGELDTTWLTVNRKEQKEQSGDTMTYNVELTLESKLRPYAVVLTYSSSNEQFPGFRCPWLSTGENRQRVLSWFTFPDSVLVVPVKFQLIGNDSVRENIEVTYNKLACPMECERELTYFIPRTKYVDEHVYRKLH